MRRTNLKDAGRYWYLVVISLVILVLLYYPCFLEISQAQVAPPITSSGLNTVVTTNGNVHNLTGGTRPGDGLNLFHSFGEFGVPTNNIANFLNETALPTDNILGRVTGVNPSNIFGIIQTTDFGNANLFLMNPAGILFGPNATLNVGGSVVFTTANSVRLFDGTNSATFYANSANDAVTTPGRVSILSAAPLVDFGFVTPAAFGFLDPTPASITVQGSRLSVDPGQSISFVGGEFTMTGGNLSAPSGQVGIVSVASAGEILHQDLRPTPNINDDSFSAMGTINLSQGAVVDVSANAAGTIQIRGGQFVITDATLSADTVNANGAPVAINIDLTGDLSISAAAVPALTVRTSGSGDAGEVRISAQNIDVTATGFGDFTPFSVIDTHTSASGKGGDVNMTATDNLTVTGDPFDSVFAIDSGTIGPDEGQGGNVLLKAKNVDISFASINTGDFVANLLGEEAAGSGGNLTIVADTLNMTQSFMVTDGFFGGRGGNLTISAHDVQLTEASALSSTGFVRSGTIQINADHLMMNDSQLEANTGAETGGGIIFTGKVGEFKNGSTIQSSTFGSGTAGKIIFTATDHLTFSDDTSASGADVRPTGLFTTAVQGTGDAAEIIVTTALLEITGGARFDATTRTSGDGGRITIVADQVSISGERTSPIFEGPLFGLAESLSSGTYSRTVGSRLCTGCGDAGPISITTRLLNLDQTAQINSSTRSTGKGGDITLTAGQSVAMTTGSSISTSSTGPGDAGNISIDAGQQFEMRNSSVTTKSEQAGGGNIEINATEQIRLVDSQVNASAFLDGGNITFDPILMILQNSQILAQAIQGAGGNITITTPLFLADSSSLVSASSQFGLNGTVRIQSPTSNLSGSLGPLTSKPSQAQSLLTQRCAALANGQASSFVVAGREQLPADPGSWLTSPIALAGLDTDPFNNETVAKGTSNLEPRTSSLSATDRVSLRRLTPARFLIANFADSEATGCHS